MSNTYLGIIGETAPPITPPATKTSFATSFLSMSPTPPRTRPLPARLLSLALGDGDDPEPTSPTTAESGRSSFDFERDDLSVLSATTTTTTSPFMSNNPFLAILLAERATEQPSRSPSLTLSSSSSSSSSSAGASLPSPVTSVTSEPVRTDDLSRSVVYKGSFSSLLDGIVDETRTRLSLDRAAEPDEGEERQFEPPVTPVLGTTPSPSSSPSPGRTPRAARAARTRSCAAPPPLRTIVASSPRHHYHHRSSTRRGSTTPRSTPCSSRRSSATVLGGGQGGSGSGFRYYPTSPLDSQILVVSPNSNAAGLKTTTTMTTNSQNKKHHEKKKKKKKDLRRSPPKVAAAKARPALPPFDAEALDLFFGVTKPVAKARKGGYESIARREGLLDHHDSRTRRLGGGEREGPCGNGMERWRTMEEFRGLLDCCEDDVLPPALDDVEEIEIDERDGIDDDEVLQIRLDPARKDSPDGGPSSSSRPRRSITDRPGPKSSGTRRDRRRPPPLELSHSNNSLTSTTTSSSGLSPDSPGSTSRSLLSLDSPISLASADDDDNDDPPSRRSRVSGSPELDRRLPCVPGGAAPVDPLSLEILLRTSSSSSSSSSHSASANLTTSTMSSSHELRDDEDRTSLQSLRPDDEKDDDDQTQRARVVSKNPEQDRRDRVRPSVRSHLGRTHRTQRQNRNPSADGGGGPSSSSTTIAGALKSKKSVGEKLRDLCSRSSRF